MSRSQFMRFIIVMLLVDLALKGYIAYMIATH